MLKNTNLPLSVLLVDDDKNIGLTLGLSLKDEGCQVTLASSVDEAIRKLPLSPFDLILTDFKMEGKTGLDLVTHSKQFYPDILIIVMTAFSSIENAVAVIKEGAFDYLPKPFNTLQLRHILNKAHFVLKLARENQELKGLQVKRDFFSGLTAPLTQKLEKFIRQVAPSDTTILLTGESGTGKSELARLIHTLSPRARQPFVTVYCTTLTESLLESELFGHTKGAFTGAIVEKTGKLEMANGGTLFLDEVGDLSVSGQSKFLRFLNDRVFEKVGGREELRTDTRVIAATNKNLTRAVASGLFREDLYYRLNALECLVSPLRDRSEDLPVLISRFFHNTAQRNDFNFSPEIPKDMMEALLHYSWPGNIRELKNVLERVLTLSRGRAPTLDDLPYSVTAKVENHISDESSDFTLNEIEKKHIMKILSREKNLEKASALLGVTSVTLWRKRKQFGLI